MEELPLLRDSLGINLLVVSNCIAYHLCCTCIYIIFINNIFSLSFSVLLNCLYLNPQVLPFSNSLLSPFRGGVSKRLYGAELPSGLSHSNCLIRLLPCRRLCRQHFCVKSYDHSFFSWKCRNYWTFKYSHKFYLRNVPIVHRNVWLWGRVDFWMWILMEWKEEEIHFSKIFRWDKPKPCIIRIALCRCISDRSWRTAKVGSHIWIWSFLTECMAVFI